MKPKVLFVDDEVAVTTGIRTLLRKQPFDILTANSAAEGLDMLAQDKVDVIVSDERMPGMCGSQFLSKVRETYPDTMRMILSGQADLKAAVSAINDGGIYRFLLKPCDPADLAASVEEALQALESKRRFKEWNAEKDASGSIATATLERALNNVYVVFQPIFTQSTGLVYAHEALVRISDPDVAHPGQLFGLAEALGRIPDVDFAIREQIAERIHALPDDTFLFVNVHPDSLRDERLYSTDNPLFPHADRIVLEITEQSSIHDSDGAEPSISDLRALKYKIALDDLGAGYAGLSSFAMLAPDVVKFDMGLIRGIHTDRTRMCLIESMAALCTELEILTVAEGVETEEEFKCVSELGCDLIQGFYLGKPDRKFLGEE